MRFGTPGTHFWSTGDAFGTLDADGLHVREGSLFLTSLSLPGEPPITVTADTLSAGSSLPFN